MAISYSKKTWVNGGSPAISAANLQVIDNGIQAACDQLDAQGTLTSAGTTAANEVGAGTGATTGEKLARLAAPAITALTAKTTLVDADLVEVADSADSNAGKKSTMANLLTYMRSATTGSVTAGYFPKYASVGSSVGIATQCVSFPATQAASSDANALDDYEEGTWTPTLTATSGTITVKSNYGSYTKVGRVVFVRCSATVDSVSTPSGGCKISGLPFTCATETNSPSRRVTVGPGATTALANATDYILAGAVDSGAATISITKYKDGLANGLTADMFSLADQSVSVSGFYVV